MTIARSTLHQAILQTILDTGRAPDVDALAELLDAESADVEAALEALADDHGVVLHPGTHTIWVAHPFALAPTNFWVESDRGAWWAGCAWCALGIVALVDARCAIRTNLGGHGEAVTITVEDGVVTPTDFVVHFPIPMVEAWDNVTHTCSVMIVFEDDDAVDAWCRRHGYAKGDVQPIATVAALARDWYGEHLAPDWRKWTTAEAREIFDRHGLTGRVWDLPASDETF